MFLQEICLLEQGSFGDKVEARVFLPIGSVDSRLRKAARPMQG